MTKSWISLFKRQKHKAVKMHAFIYVYVVYTGLNVVKFKVPFVIKLKIIKLSITVQRDLTSNYF